MKQYTFGEVTKTLKANTYYLEEKVKEAAGLTDEMEQRVFGLQTQYRKLTEKLKSAQGAELEKIASDLEKLEDEVQALNKKMLWYLDFDRTLAVLNVLFLEGADGITKENIGRNQAKEVWADFFI